MMFKKIKKFYVLVAFVNNFGAKYEVINLQSMVTVLITSGMMLIR
jgi:hypothetical protein